MDDQDNRRQEILARRDAEGRMIYDHVRRDATGQWWGRRHDDHTKEDRV